MKKDQAFYVPILCLIFLAGLIALRYLPPVTVFGYELKTIDMFSDVEKEPASDIIKIVPKVEPKVEIRCPKNKICFEDYSVDQNMFKTLFLSIDNLKSDTLGKVRIAFFGDSFIEGDVFCGDFRDLLQEKFGGMGVGWVPVTSEVSQFRQTIKEDFKNYTTFDAVHHPKEKVPYPPFGICTQPLPNNSATYYSTHFSPRTDKLPNFRILYQSKSPFSAKVISDGNSQNIQLKAGKNIQDHSILINKSKKVNLTFASDPNIFLYGFSFEDQSGVYVDNFSLRGNAGLSLLSSSSEMHKSLNRLQDYKLIILQYGVNAVSEKASDFAWYTRMMNKVITEMKASYPQAGILLISVGDRSKKINGAYKTLPTIKLMVEAQRAIAAENKIAFWNMYEAMGGESSMVDYVTANPPKANKDYTHINFLGGKEIGTLLFNSLLFEYEKAKSK
ncbi:hypothetical protein O2K51_12245 [Apibacter raozihei]|uniref:hypothetical protein n=1 Tax=Apibacter raozihei TaxID=2500547 RepID=UPI000FE35662|nr:hypothetical protein [Apibacter raozihei]